MSKLVFNVSLLVLACNMSPAIAGTSNFINKANAASESSSPAGSFASVVNNAISSNQFWLITTYLETPGNITLANIEQVSPKTFSNPVMIQCLTAMDYGSSSTVNRILNVISTSAQSSKYFNNIIEGAAVSTTNPSLNLIQASLLALPANQLPNLSEKVFGNNATINALFQMNATQQTQIMNAVSSAQFVTTMQQAAQSSMQMPSFYVNVLGQASSTNLQALPASIMGNSNFFYGLSLAYAASSGPNGIMSKFSAAQINALNNALSPGYSYNNGYFYPKGSVTPINPSQITINPSNEQSIKTFNPKQLKSQTPTGVITESPRHQMSVPEPVKPPPHF